MGREALLMSVCPAQNFKPAAGTGDTNRHLCLTRILLKLLAIACVIERLDPSTLIRACWIEWLVGIPQCNYLLKQKHQVRSLISLLLRSCSSHVIKLYTLIISNKIDLYVFFNISK